MDFSNTNRELARVPVRERQQRPANELVLFIALETFLPWSYSGEEWCYGSQDAIVGRAAKLEFHPEFDSQAYQSKLTYFRVEGEAHCVWMPAETDCKNASGHDQRWKIGCGEYFWAIWNGQSGRYEAVSPGRRQDLDSFTQTAECPCKWFGFATWKVVTVEGVSTWELVENHCSGCYDTDRAGIPTDHRFSVTTSNSDWIREPAPLASDYAGDPDFRYVTCCNVEDVAPPPPCELTCCYVVPVPLPSCSGGSKISQAILQVVTGGETCLWTTDLIDYVIWDEQLGSCCDLHPSAHYFLTVRLARVSIVGRVLRYVLYMDTGWRSDDAIDGTTCPIVLGAGTVGAGAVGGGRTTITVEYTLAEDPDCTNDPAATRKYIAFSPYSFGSGDDCMTCARDDAYWSSLWPGAITVKRIACNETTTTTESSTTGSSTTGSSTTGSSTTGSSTTGSSTTGSSTTGSSTTGSSTTGSSTTGSSTTGSSTTGTTGSTGSTGSSSSSTTTGACTGFVRWTWQTDSDPHHWGSVGGGTGCIDPCTAPAPTFDGTFGGQTADVFCA